MRWFRILIIFFILGKSETEHSAAYPLSIPVVSGDSVKPIQKKPERTAPASLKKADDDTPFAVDFSKKTLRLKLFGNTVDFDFKKRVFQFNKDKKGDEE
jgi:hypothetical protein